MSQERIAEQALSSSAPARTASFKRHLVTINNSNDEVFWNTWMPPPLNLPLPLALNVNQSGYDSYSTASHAESESGFRPELSHFEALFFGMETQSSRDQEERRGLKGNEA